MANNLKTEYVRTDSLRPHPDNPRRGDLNAIKESLEHHGQYRPIVVNRSTMEVLAGNHTLRAATELGWSQIAVNLVEVDEEQAKRILVVDNRTSDLAGYDTEALAELLQELPDLEGTGYDSDALGDLLDELAPDPVADDEPPALPAEPKTRPGDLYRLGSHRLLCADARDPESYAPLMEAERAELLWTDPPYGVDYEGKTAEALTIRGDGAGLKTLLSESFSAADSVLSPAPGSTSPTPPASCRLPSGSPSWVRAGDCARPSCG